MSRVSADLEVKQSDLIDFAELLEEREAYDSDPNETDDDDEADELDQHLAASPKKETNSRTDDIRSYSRIPYLKAPLLVPQRTNSITDELFLITNNKSRVSHESEFSQGRRLNNSIMVNVMDAINGQNTAHQRSIPGDDWELDDQLRSRFYKGRPSPSVTSKSDRDLERTLDNFLVETNPKTNAVDFDKENISPPTKRSHIPGNRRDDNKENFISGGKKGTFGPLGTARPSFKQGRSDYNNTTKLDSNKSIPVLRPLTSNRQRNAGPFDGFMIMSKQFNKVQSLFNSDQSTASPVARFEPRHRQISHALKPILKFKKLENQLTFIVDSLTGSVHDATQFGTELNSVNCNGFPLPETINEIVQIPTTEGKAEEQKVAFIKAFKIEPMTQQKNINKDDPQVVLSLADSSDIGQKTLGYYSYSKYLESKEQGNITGNGVQVQTQLPLANPAMRKRRGGFQDEDDEDTLMLSSSALERSSSPIQTDGEALSPLKKRKVQWSTDLEW